MDGWLLTLLISLATHRATRLVTRDSFPPAAAVRQRIQASAPDWVGELVGCHWCAGVWLAAAVTAASCLLLPEGVPAPLLVWPAAAAVAGWLGNVEAEREAAAERDVRREEAGRRA